MIGVNGTGHKLIPSTNPKLDTPSVKKRNRRVKSGSKSNDSVDDSDGYEFVIVSLENKSWHFDASNSEDRECWVAAIEQQILSSLQSMESEKSKYKINSSVDETAIQSIRTVPGNKYCVDCDSPSIAMLYVAYNHILNNPMFQSNQILTGRPSTWVLSYV